jgi:hypothetical protein
MFTPPNYETHPDGTKDIDEKGRVKCKCGRKVWPFVLVKVTQFDNVDQNWACDGCWTDWQRHRKPLKKVDNHKDLMHNDRQKSRKAWDEDWLSGHGAPKELIDKMKQTKRRA